MWHNKIIRFSIVAIVMFIGYVVFYTLHYAPSKNDSSGAVLDYIHPFHLNINFIPDLQPPIYNIKNQ